MAERVYDKFTPQTHERERTFRKNVYDKYLPAGHKYVDQGNEDLPGHILSTVEDIASYPTPALQKYIPVSRFKHDSPPSFMTFERAPSNIPSFALSAQDANGDMWTRTGRFFEAESVGVSPNETEADYNSYLAELLWWIGEIEGGTIRLPAGILDLRSHQLPNNIRICGYDNRPHSRVSVLRRSTTLDLDDSIFTVAEYDNASAARLAENIILENFEIDGSTYTWPSWLSNPNTEAAINNPEWDYSSPGQLDLAKYPGNSIHEVVAAGRRNPLYEELGRFGLFKKVNGLTVRGLYAHDYHNTLFYDAGCKDALFWNNHFDACCKNDHAFFCIWVQSDGNPERPVHPAVYPEGHELAGQAHPQAGQYTQPWYVGSQNSRVMYNVAENLERIFSLFAPTEGGYFMGNIIRNVGESGIFLPANLNKDSDTTVEVAFNKINGVRRTDIVARGFESHSNRNLFIHDNSFQNLDAEFFYMPGGTDRQVYNNYFKNCYRRAHNVPFGPFGERYKSDVLDGDPVAGTPVDIANAWAMTIGTFKDSGAIRHIIRNNTFVDEITGISRPLGMFKLGRAGLSGSGAQNVSESIYILDNNFLGMPSGMRNPANFLLEQTAVMSANMDIRIKGNIGHVSQGDWTGDYTFPVIVTNDVALAQTLGSAGNLTLNGSATSGGTLTMLEARKIDILSAGNDSGITFTVTGTNSAGAPLVEVVTGANADTATTVASFLTVTQIATSGATASTVRVRVNRSIVDFIVGFRPSKVEAYTVSQATEGGKLSFGSVIYSQGLDPSTVDSGVGFTAVSAGGHTGYTNFLIHLKDDTGATAFSATLGSWLPAGFRIVVGDATVGASTRFVVSP